MKAMLHGLAATIMAACAAVPVAGQSDILLRLRSGSPVGDRVRVDSAGGLVAISVAGVGIIPHTGAGSRMMWHPSKAALRAGAVDGTAWDDSNVGYYSLAIGYNTISAGTGAIATGSGSVASGGYSVAMGLNATATGTSAVAMGSGATAGANHSIALGRSANSNGKVGAIVIADASTTDSLMATTVNQFSVRADGGIRFFTNPTHTTGVSVGGGGGSWSSISDRNRKMDFLALDPEEILARIRQLPVSTWRYIGEHDRAVRHIGPMAQDWERVFGLSGDSTTINSGDFDGVNLAAIQALDGEVVRLRAENADVRAESAAIRADLLAISAENAALRARLDRIEALLADRGKP